MNRHAMTDSILQVNPYPGNPHVVDASSVSGMGQEPWRGSLLGKVLSKIGCCLMAAGAVTSAWADGPAVKVEVEGINAVVTVAPGAVERAGVVYLAYGPEDCGETFESWPRAAVVTDNLQPEGGAFELEIPDRIEISNMKLRAFVFERIESLKSDGSAYVDLQETPSLDRRYEFRFRQVTVPPSGPNSASAIFGGVTRSGVTPSFQVYGAADGEGFVWKCIFSPDDGGSICAFAAVQGEVYDLRMDVAAGRQTVLWKRADDDEYTKSGELALETLPYAGNLLLFARNDTSRLVCKSCAIYEYKESVLSSGEIIKHLVADVDENGVGRMLDLESGTPCPNAGTGNFAFIAEPGEVLAWSSVASYCGVRMKVSGEEMTVEVDPGCSDGTNALYLAWGKADAGMDYLSWDHVECLSNSIPPEGLILQADLASLKIGRRSVIRALVGSQPFELRRSFGGALIPLDETLGPDRQFDMRISIPNSAGVVFMGGLDSGKKHIFQLYHNGTAILVWFGDDVSYELFKVGTGDPDQYDVRIVLQNGIQCAYWKRADEEHYNLGPSATIASFASGIGLSICGRGKDGYPLARFGRFRETEVSTGRVIRDFLPVCRGGREFVYDFAAAAELQRTGVTCDSVTLGQRVEFVIATDAFQLPSKGMALILK